MRGAGYVDDPAVGTQEVLQRTRALIDKFVLPHVPGAIDAAAELWPWLLASWAVCGVVLLLFLAGLYTSAPEPRRWCIPRGSRDAQVKDHAVAAPDGVVLRGISKGSGPAVLLVHSAGCTSDIFSFIFKRLSLRGYRVIAFDLRGHGASDPVADLSAQALAADLHAVLEELDLSDATVVGHGLGGYAVVALAQYHPETATKRVGRMVLVSAFAETPPEMQSLLGKFYRAAFAWCLMHTLLRWRSAARLLMRPFFGRSITSTLEEEWRRAVLNCPRKVWMQGLDVGTENVSEGLAKVTCPVHIMCGAGDNFARSAQTALCKARPDLEVTYMPGIGHITPWEAPDSIFNVVYSLVDPGPLPSFQKVPSAETKVQALARRHAKAAKNAPSSKLPALPKSVSDRLAQHKELAWKLLGVRSGGRKRE